MKDKDYRRSVIETSGERCRGRIHCFLWGNVFLHLSCLPALAAFLKRLESCYSVDKGKKIVLRCEVVDPNIQVKWLKNGQEIKPSAKYMITLSFLLVCVLRAYNTAAVSSKAS